MRARVLGAGLASQGALARDTTVAIFCTQTSWGHRESSQRDIPSGTGKSSSQALRRDREDLNPNFLSLGEVPGSGRATLWCRLTVPLRVFCHQPNTQGWMTPMLESHSTGRTL